jgi:hypothetical protein
MNKFKSSNVLKLMVSLALLALMLLVGPLAQAESLQDLLSRKKNVKGKVTSIVKSVTTEYKVTGFKIGGSKYTNDFDNDNWRRECFAYQGMGHLDNKYLDFVYGGDDIIIFCLTAPQVRNGGKLKISAVLAADRGDVAISVSFDNLKHKKVAAIDQLGTLEVKLPPSDSGELYIMLDGRAGNGVVVDDLVIELNATGPKPTPTPVEKKKDEKKDTSVRKLPEGQGVGERVKVSGDPGHISRGRRNTSGVKKANER